MKKILVLGGTGAMGRYLVPKLAKLDYQVDVVSLDRLPDLKNIHYIQSDIMDDSVLEKQLSAGYDGIVDFMVYTPDEFRDRVKELLKLWYDFKARFIEIEGFLKEIESIKVSNDLYAAMEKIRQT